jgi:carboxylate-amine ligase
MTKLLKSIDANVRLMPTAMHPLMNPINEVKLWPHDNNEVYDAYDRIFGCKGHGWSNLQSMHINLPFSTDQEFEKLHTAIRFLLPILPALSASSPIVEGKITGALDNRLLFYQKNQARIPSIAGLVIPEQVSSMGEYKEKILETIYRDITPFDPGELMREDWLNSRGAISRFGRQTIEIRVLDIQECPSIDLAIADLICATLKTLVAGEKVPSAIQRSFQTDALKQIFDETALKAERAVLKDEKYLTAWGIKQSSLSAQELWEQIFQRVSVTMSSSHKKTITELLRNGSLASRILKATGVTPSPEKIREVYRQLCNCLDNNQMFQP